MEEGTITIKKTTLWKYSTFALLAVIAILVVVMITGKSTTGNVVANPGSQVAAPQGKVEVSLDDDPMIGDKNAPVTIVEFSDYQCPFCRKFWSETYSQIKKDYIDTGKVRLVFRDFPLSSIHAQAEISAEAANCVREKGGDEAYFKMHDKMFEEQNILDSGNAAGPVTKTVTYTAEDLKSWAKDLGYDISSCLDSGKYASEISKDQTQGSSYGVQGTPAFFIEGKLISGAQPYSAFKAAIDAELA